MKEIISGLGKKQQQQPDKCCFQKSFHSELKFCIIMLLLHIGHLMPAFHTVIIFEHIFLISCEYILYFENVHC
jgi:hypothetical protein